MESAVNPHVPQWSDWHGTARKKEVAETAKDGNAFEILLTDFSCTMVAHSGFVFKFCCGIVLHFRVCNGCVSKDDALDVRLRMFAMFWMLAEALDPKIMR